MKDIKKIIIVISIIVVLMIFAGIFIYYFYQINPSTKVKACIKEEIKQLQHTISRINTSTYNSLLVSQNANKKKKTTNIKPLSTTTELDFNIDINKSIEKNSKISILENLLNNSDISFVTNADLENKYIDSKIDYKYDSEKLTSNLYFDENKIYFKAKDLLDKCIIINDENNEISDFLLRVLNSGITLKEVNYLLSIVSKAIDGTKISDKISSTSETLKISNSVRDTSKDVLTIDNELVVRVCKNILKMVSKDETALKIIQKVEGSEDLADVQRKVIKAYNGLDKGRVTILNEDQKLLLSTYMTGVFPKFVMQSLDYDLNSNYNGNITLLNMNIDDFSQHVILTQGDIKATLNWKNLSNDKYNIQLLIDKAQNTEYVANLSGVISPKKIDATYKVAKDNQQLVSGSIKYSQSFESSKKNSELELSLDAQNIDYGKGSVKISSTTKQINTVNKQNIDDTIKYNELSLNDRLLLKSKLNKKVPSLSKLLLSTNK